MLLFADLHCSPKTLDLCLEILRDIHTRAIKTQQQIGFLGDFFDTVYRRGTIPVDMLNTLLDFFEKEWKIPMIMIPGNHDYIDASETEHALEPFRHASGYIHVLDQACVLGNVLWIPWKRDNNILRETFKLYEGQYECIFGHFDIIGANINNNTKSDRGLKKEDFPCQVISGHYHKPQTMGKVTYIGSPYQTSMSEAQQDKRFISYSNARNFKSVWISHGPKRYKMTENPETWPNYSLKKGDIVHMDSFYPEKLTTEALDYVNWLKECGVHVILQRHMKDTDVAKSLLNAEKELSPLEMFKKYCTHFNLKDLPGYDRAIKMLLKVAENDENDYVPKILRFGDIKFEGFGPFKGQQQIVLDSRGLTKITGKWEDGAVGSSNGAGKSMATVSAFLWCLTGYSDMRASTCLKKSQASAACINHVTKQCRVALTGSIGGKTFKVERASSLHDKTTFLELFYDNQRLTRSTQYLTQEKINDLLFRIPKGNRLPKQANKRLHAWLMKTIVWEQAGGGKNWLELNDKGTKEELLLLCNMNVWEEIYESVQQQYTFSVSNRDSSRLLMENSNKTLISCNSRYARVLLRRKLWVQQNQEKLDKFKEEIKKWQQKLDDLGPAPVLTEAPENKNKRKHDQITKDYFHCEKIFKDAVKKVAIYYDINDLDVAKQKYTIDVVSPVYSKPAPKRVLLDNAIAEKAIRKQQLSLLKKAANAPTKCPTCKQPLCVKHVDPKEIERAQHEVASAGLNVDKQRKAIKTHEYKVSEQKKKETRIKSWRTWKKSEQDFKTKKQLYDTIEAEKAIYEFKKAEWQAQRVVIQHHEHQRQQALTALELINRQLEEATNTLPPMLDEEEEVKQQIIDCGNAIARYKELFQNNVKQISELENIKNWFSVKGIQTYVVECMLHKMSTHTTDWCKYLFDEDSQGSPIFTMDLDEKENISKVLSFGDSKMASALSGGQYRRLQIAAFMAWRIQSTVFTGIHTNLILLDEPASSIDTVGFKQMENALKTWCERESMRTCMFISHEVTSDKGSSIYDTHIEIRAKKGNSYVYDYDERGQKNLLYK